MGLYRNSIFQGGWFSFNSTKENWAKISKKMYDYFFGSVMFDEIFGASKTTEELFIKTDQNFDFVKFKKMFSNFALFFPCANHPLLIVFTTLFKSLFPHDLQLNL